MKFAIWTNAAALGLASLALTALGGMFDNFYRALLGGKPLPAVTAFLVDLHGWALLIPIPWLLAAVWLSRRDAATPARTFAYAGLTTLAITFLFTFAAIALLLPFVTITVNMR